MDILLSTAIQAAIEAGAEIMKIYSQDFEVEIKSDSSPLTIADKNANAIIVKYLLETDIPIISEENKQTDYAQRKNWETCWIVDPLDGTKEFIKRNGEFTVNIALVKNNKPILGVIYVPAKKILFYGDVNQGIGKKIVLQEHQFSTINISDYEDLCPLVGESNLIKVVGSRSHKSLATEEFIDKLQLEGKEVEIVSMGSSLKFCMVAEGKASVYPRFAPTMEWDTAAGHAICNAVGLKVMQVNHSEELQYNKEDLLNPFFIVK
jgi:3'(2'), 5'-bisphosphate nucleotidase